MITHHGRDSGFACRIQGVLIDRQAHADRGAEHDTAAVGHRVDRRLGDEQLSGHVGLKEAIEVGLGDGFQRSPRLGGEPPHDRGADSAAPSGDQDALARQA